MTRPRPRRAGARPRSFAPPVTLRSAAVLFALPVALLLFAAQPVLFTLAAAVGLLVLRWWGRVRT